MNSVNTYNSVNRQYKTERSVQVKKEQIDKVDDRSETSGIKKYKYPIAGVIGAALLAAVIIRVSKKKNKTGEILKPPPQNTNNNPKPVSEPVKNIGPKIKTFINKEGVKIENVIIDNGIAKQSDDGSMFSGIMKVARKDGKLLSFDFENGLMTNVKIDGKLFQSYEQYLENPRNEALLTIQYNNNGTPINKIVHSFYETGSIKGMYVSEYSKNSEYKIREITEFSRDGNIISESQLTDNYITAAKIYDEAGKKSGNLIRQIGILRQHHLGKNTETSFLDNDSILSKKIKHGSFPIIKILDSIVNLGLEKIYKVIYYNKEGNILSEISTGEAFTVLQKKSDSNIFQIKKLWNELLIDMRLNSGINKFAKSADGELKASGKKQFTKHELEEMLKNLQEAKTIAEKEGLEIETNDVLNIFEQIKNYLKKIGSAHN